MKLLLTSLVLLCISSVSFADTDPVVDQVADALTCTQVMVAAGIRATSYDPGFEETETYANLGILATWWFNRLTGLLDGFATRDELRELVTSEDGQIMEIIALSDSEILSAMQDCSNTMKLAVRTDQSST